MATSGLSKLKFLIAILVVCCFEKAENQCTETCSKSYRCTAPPDVCEADHQNTLCEFPASDTLASCLTWAASGECLINPSLMWTLCPDACHKYATCECSVLAGNAVDSNCTCGEYAAAGLCESDVTVRSNCSYTCGRRMDPDNYCTPIPLTALPSHATWKLSEPSVSSFSGNASYLQTAVMICEHGYRSDSVIKTVLHICDPFTENAATGNWLQIKFDQPNCLRVTCPDPPSFASLYYVNSTLNGEFLYGDSVVYYCQAGTVLGDGFADTPAATCTLNEPAGWTFNNAGKEPICLVPPCQSLPDVANANYSVSANQTGGVATYACSSGFAPDNKDAFLKICQHDGSWLPSEVPKCSGVMCPKPSGEDYAYLIGLKTEPDAKYYYNDKVETRCTLGSFSLYLKPGSENTPLESVTRTCSDTGAWTTETLSCLPVQCEMPQSFEIAEYRIRNATSALSSLTYGMVVAFECDWTQGYAPSANQTSEVIYWRCNENSTWDKQSLSCSAAAALKFEKKTVVAYESSNAVATASIVLGILGFFMGIIVCLDYLTLARDVKDLRRNFGHFLRRLRDSSRVKQLHDLRHRLRNEVDKKKYLAKRQAETEKKQLQTAGYAVDETADLENGDSVLVANPFDRRLMSGSRKQPEHIEGAMDLPESLELRVGGPVAEDHVSATDSDTDP